MAFADLLRLETSRMGDVADVIDELNGLTFPAWTDYTPTISTSGTMDYTGVTISIARYLRIGNIGYIRIRVIGTTSGTPSTEIQFTLPSGWSFSDNSTGGIIPLGAIGDGPSLVARFFYSANTRIAVRNLSSANWGIGASRSFSGTVIMELL